MGVKTMTTAELQTQISAMRESIKSQQERLDELEKQLESANELDDIDKPLEIENDEEVYYISDVGIICRKSGRDSYILNTQNRAFKQLKYAEMYREKTQHIADLLHFKWLFDRDYEPDWSDENENKYTVWYCYDEKKFMIDITPRSEYRAAVYFSTAELAKKCADWLNRKAEYNE
jgi:hypothetical protein